MKKLSLLALAIIGTFSLQAQRIDLGVNLIGALPQGDNNVGINDNGITTDVMAPFGTGIGAGIDFNYWFGDHFAVGLEAGYVSYAEKTNDQSITFIIPVSVTTNTKGTSIPVMVKASYYFLDGPLRPYAGVGIGYALYQMESTVSGQFIEESTLKYDQNGLLVSPRAGVLFQLGETVALNFNVQYNLVQNAVDGDMEVEVDGQVENWTDTKIDATNNIGINLGVIFTLAD